MKILYCFYPIFLLSAWLHASAATLSAAPQHRPEQQQVFIENRGQWDGRALFCMPAPQMTVWGTASGLVYDYQRMDEDGERIHGHVVRMEFRSALQPAVSMSGQSAAHYNYLRGNDPSRWVTDVRSSREVWYNNIYKGIDTRFYIDGENGLPRYDFVLAPGANPASISIQFRGMTSLAVEDKELRLGLPSANIVQGGLFAYQIEDGVRREIACSFVQHADGSVGFELGAYNHAQTLVIDPLVYSTYLGGVVGDESYGIAVDGAGNNYIAGTTLSQNYPTTTGAYNTTKSGSIDIFVSKVNPTGSDLVYSTFIGGNNDDFGYDIAVDAGGRVAVTGSSFSSDFPVTNQALDRTLNGDRDAIVVCLSETGNRLDGSTYLGGNNWDEGYSIAMDAGGTVYVTGMTTSADFPLANPFDDTYNDAQDVFIAKISHDCSGLQFGSFLGGTSGDYGNSIAVDNSGSILLAGVTGSSNFRTTASAFDQTFGGNVGTTDGFVAKISSGGGLVFSSYIGGTSNDEARGVAPDGQGGVIVGGWTESATPGFPITAGVYDIELSGRDAFLARFNSSGSSLQACTYLGQIGIDAITDIAVDANGIVYAVGNTQSSSFPTTPGAHDASYNGGIGDAFLVKFPSTFAASSLLYGTYLGGNNYDEAKGLAVDGDGNATISGITRSGDFPTTVGAVSRAFGGMSDAFISQVGTSEPQLTLLEPTGGESWCAGNFYKITWKSRSVAYVRIELSSNGGATYPVVLADSVLALTKSWSWSIPMSIAPGNQYRIRIVNVDNTLLRDGPKNNLTINIPPVITGQPQPVTACVGANASFRVEMNASPAADVQWQFTTDAVNWTDVPSPAGQMNPLVLADVQLSQHNRRYRMIAMNVCNTSGVISSTATLFVRSQPRILTAPANVTVCQGGNAIMEVVVDEPGVTYQWRRDGKALPGANARQLTIYNASAVNSGSYDVVITGACPPAVVSSAATVFVQLPPDVLRLPVFRSVLCAGDSRDTTLTLTNSGPLDMTVKIVMLTNPRFTIVSPTSDFVIPAGVSSDIVLRFTPTRADIEQGELVLSTMPCDHDMRIPIAARADSVRIASTDVEFEPMYQCDTARTAVVRIVNTGTTNLPVHRVLFSHKDFTLVSPTLPFVVKSNGGRVDAVVRFADDGVADAVLASAEFISDTCKGISSVSNLSVVRYKLAHKPSQGQLDFGAIPSCDSHIDRSFILFNTGSAPLVIDSLAVDNTAFGVVKPAAGFGIRPGEFAEITVRFTGGSGGNATGRLTMYESVCRVSSSIELRGSKSGTSLVAGIASLNMGSFLACSSIPDTVFPLVNLGADTVVIEHVQIDAPFDVISPAFPIAILPGASVPVSIRMQNGASGDFNGQALFNYHTKKCSSSVAVAISASRLRPAVVVTPDKIVPLQLGACDEYRDTTIIVRNIGQMPLTLDRVDGTAVVSLLTALPIVVKPGRTAELLLRAEPGSIAKMIDTLLLHFAECDTTIPMVVGVQKPGASFALAADGGGDTLRFDDVFDCGEQTRKRRVKVNVVFAEGDPVDVSASLVSLQPSGPFSVSLKSGTKLTAGEQWFDVEFAPAADGTYQSVLSVTFLPCGITKKLVFSGCRKRGQMMTPKPVEFGTIQQGGSRTMRVAYHNQGTAEIEVHAIAVDAPFAVISTKPLLPARIAPGDSITVDIEYTAGAGRAQGLAVLHIRRPCADSVKVVLIGEGKNIPSTVLTGIALNFGDVPVGTPAQRSLVISNQGPTDAVLYGAPLLSGADAGTFSIVTAPLAVIPSGKSTSFDIGFLPATAGDKKAVCRIEYNGVPLEVELTGRGVEKGPVSSSVYLPDTSASPHTRGLRLPLTLVPGANFAYALVDSFAAEIRFNASLFLPVSVEHGSIVSDTTVEGNDISERVLVIKGRHRNEAELCVLVGDVLLGDALSTPLGLSFRWLNQDVSAEAHSGKLALEGVREGVLLRSKGMPGIVRLGPNPSSETATVEVRTIEEGEHELELFDATGKKVWSVVWQKASGRLGALHTFVIPSVQLSSGSYSLRYKAPGGYTNTQRLIVVH